MLILLVYGFIYYINYNNMVINECLIKYTVQYVYANY